MSELKFEEIVHRNQRFAFIIYSPIAKVGAQFLTPPNLMQQVAIMLHPAGKIITPHFHNKLLRTIDYTSEVLIILEGKLRVAIYALTKQKIVTRTLKSGDIIVLERGGHGFEVIEDIKMIEIKQGPYLGEGDKTRFDPGDLL